MLVIGCLSAEAAGSKPGTPGAAGDGDSPAFASEFKDVVSVLVHTSYLIYLICLKLNTFT